MWFTKFSLIWLYISCKFETFLLHELIFNPFDPPKTLINEEPSSLEDGSRHLWQKEIKKDIAKCQRSNWDCSLHGEILLAIKCILFTFSFGKLFREWENEHWWG